MDDNDKGLSIGNPLREIGSQFKYEFMNPSISSRGTKDGYKYFLKVEIQKEFHDLLVDAELAGMVVASVGQVAGLNGDYSEALKKEEEAKPERCPQAIEYHKKHSNQWPSNTAEALCKEDNFYQYILTVYTDKAYTIFNEYQSLNGILKLHCDEISSKSELDTNHDALTTFKGMLADYRKFVQDNQ